MDGFGLVILILVLLEDTVCALTEAAA